MWIKRGRSAGRWSGTIPAVGSRQLSVQWPDFRSPTENNELTATTILEKTGTGGRDMSMSEVKAIASRLWKDEQGQDLTEYALLVTLVPLGAVAAMSTLATALSQTFSSAAANVSAIT
jgi:Flp pilus assembly pilin Flp